MDFFWESFSKIEVVEGAEDYISSLGPVMVGCWTSFGNVVSLIEVVEGAEDYMRSFGLVRVGCWTSFRKVFVELKSLRVQRTT